MASFITDWVWALYVPLGMLLLLMVMIYFHRHHWLKYVYLVSASCLLIEVFSLLYLQWQSQGVSPVSTFSLIVVFLFMSTYGLGLGLAVLSVGAFLVEYAQRQLWARIVIGIALFVLIVLFFVCVYWFMQGVASLNSG
ncbi:hypothetical protein [Alloprevotella tannerae]|uniref:hypothetical protein n=1 Tax=Alloprevotella tannerae TaxID=76122 RepID=UPI0028EC3413|nr:hypothetical protein [Alloprevotella tannerae]